MTLTTPFSDPDRWRVLSDRADEARRQFRHGEISIDVFRATLYGLGFRGRAIETEINENYPTGGINGR